MIYSSEKLQELKQEFNTTKKRTKWTTIGLFALALLIGVLTYFVEFFLFIVLGALVTFIAFSYMFFQLTETHKKYKNDIEFYSDIIFSEKQEEEVEFVRYGETVISNKRRFKTIVVYRYKTESNFTLLYDENYLLDMEQNERYQITKANNILIDYRGEENA